MACKRAFLQPLRQRLAFDVLHDEVVQTVLLADVVEGADVRMVELGDGFGFALETGLELGAFGEVLGKDLDGNGAVEAGVRGFVDLAHATGSDGSEYLVGAEPGSGGEGHS